MRTKLGWAFIAVTFTALVLSFAGLNLGLYSLMMHMHEGEGFMMPHGQMMPGSEFAGATVRWSLLSSLAALAIAGGAGYLTAERITRSLHHLLETVQNLDMRNLSRRVAAEGGDEIADLAKAFNGMSDRLEAAERSRRQLLADVAHELRHPLAIMQGRLDLMLDGKVAVDQPALLPLQDEVIRLTRLVGDLRDLSLAEVGGLSLHIAPINLVALLTSLLGNLEPVAEDRGIILEAEIQPELQVQGDSDRLRQVFLNLMANALHYAGAGGRVTVKAWHESATVHVAVTDSGPGIAAEELPHIFDRFYRADKSRSRGTGGSGLGLAIVRSIVELHQGKIAVKSELGVGSTFTVTLPVTV